MNFVHQTFPQRVLFGAGRRRSVADEAARAKVTRALVIATSPNRSAEVETLLDFLRQSGSNLRAWTDVAHALINTKEFIFLN